MKQVLLSAYGKNRYIMLDSYGTVRQIIDWGDENERY